MTRTTYYPLWAAALVCCSAISAAQTVNDVPTRIFETTISNSGADFGSALQLDGDWAVASAPRAHGALSNQVGILSFWRREGDGYSLAQMVEPTACAPGGGTTNCILGRLLAMNGSIVAASSAGGDIAGGDKGLVHVYRLQGQSWELADLIRAPRHATSTFTGFGSAIGVEGETLAIGALGFQVASPLTRGVVHIFEPDGNDHWLETQRLVQLPPHGTDAAFGSALALENGVLAVGAWSLGWRVQIYEKTAGVWSIDQTVISPLTNGPHFDPSIKFGRVIALDPTANVLAVATNSNSAHGSVFVYERSTTTGQFELVDRLFPTEGTDPGFFVGFGGSVAISNGLMAIGARNEHTNGFRTGAVEIYRREVGGWVKQPRLAPPQSTPMWATLGHAVAVDDSRVLASDILWGEGNMAPFTGRAYLWEFSAGTETCPQPSGGPALALMYDDSERERLTASVSSLAGRGIGIFVAGTPSSPVAFGAGEMCVGQARRISPPIAFVSGQEWIYADLVHPDWTAPQSTAFQFVYSRRDGVFPQGASSARVVD
ncbi:MAG: hypothetical protein DRJ50_09830 [Actinobacteria bacterium]|nr:MAG: hypothetical protein DRJ50_09830 [Actinomycetota bacterium]